MKIQATCNTCHRTFLLSQIGADSDAPGRCPFCGARFARHYTGVLVDAVAEAEGIAGRFVHILGRLQSIESGFDLDLEGLLRELSDRVKSQDQQAAS